jgi:phosphatidylserine/phosphatidylglycerophosphate/cardiolipin synthase-like enzyme/uncharacterized membrane protein YdjX (TVP38/TMEM64 family)
LPAQRDSLFVPGSNCQLVAHADRAAALVDAEDYFRHFSRAAEQAQDPIIILGWDFDSRTPLHFDGEQTQIPSQLGEFLNALVRRRRRLRVYLLIWDYPLIFGTDRELRPIYGLGWRPRRRVHLRYDNTHPVGGSHHQKVVVVDDAVAFCGGLDLTLKRWDTCRHDAGDERRSVDGTPYPPFHDAMIAVDGDAARALGQLARERWRRATGYVIPPPRSGRDPWPPELEPRFRDVLTAQSRTLPPTETEKGVREVEALYLDMIKAAKRYIYFENQYFTSELIRAALARRLAEPDPPEIVIVTRRLSHGWLEEATMQQLRTRVVKSLREADGHSRFDAYYPDTPGLAEGTCIDVHSKLAVIDDNWLRIGSANLSNRSMGVDTECDLSLEAGGDEAKIEAVRAFRDSLLSEHLDVSPERWRSELAAGGSLHAAIRRLQCEGRTLKRLSDEEEPAGAAVLAAVADPELPVSLDRLVDYFSPQIKRKRGAGPAWGMIVPFACVVLALFLAWRYTPLADYFTPDRMRSWARASSSVAWAPFAVILAYVPVAFTMFPRPLLTLFAIVAFGPMIGFCVAMAGIAVSALAAYYAGRRMKRDTVRRIAGPRLNRTSEVLRRRGLMAAIAVSIAPVAPFAVVGIVAGAVRLQVWQYLLGVMIGNAPGTLVTTFFGQQIAHALEDPSQINYWLVALAAAVLIALVVVVRRWVQKVEAEDDRSGERKRTRRPTAAAPA